MKTKFGKTVLLTEDVNCIPKGVYRLRQITDFFIELRCGKNIWISLSLDCLDKIKFINSKQIIRTTRTEFENRYYQLLTEQPPKKYHGNQPFTYCVFLQQAVN